MIDDTGNLQGIGYKKPPEETQFGKPKGNHRNRNGRPKSFDALRKLVQRILAEDSPSKDGNNTTRVEAMLKTMANSKAPADRALLLAYGYGKPKDELDVTSAGNAITFVIHREQSDSGHNPPPAPA
jgi:hypothetical protein